MSKIKIVIDDGHGLAPVTAGKRTPPIPELGGRVIYENEFNREVSKYLKGELLRCGFEVKEAAPGDADTSLANRVKVANDWDAYAFISNHFNAYDGEFNGYDPEGNSIHIYKGMADSRKLAECIGKYLQQGTAQNYRGIIEQDLYVLRNTHMTAVLIENGFMDNKREAMLMIDVDFQKECAREQAMGICEYFGVPYVANEPVKTTQVSDPVQTTSSSSVGYQVKVTADVLNIRKGPGVNNGVVGQIKDKGTYTIVEKSNGWGKLKSGAGWISLAYTSKVTATTEKSPYPCHAISTGNNVNVRKGPGTNYGRITGYPQVNRGNEFMVYGLVNGWYKVNVAGYDGYIIQDYVKLG